MRNNWNSATLVGGVDVGAAIVGNCQHPLKLDICILYDPTILFFSRSNRKVYTVPPKPCTRMFTAAPFLKLQTKKKPKCPSTVQISKFCSICITEHYPAVRTVCF